MSGDHILTILYVTGGLASILGVLLVLFHERLAELFSGWRRGRGTIFISYRQADSLPYAGRIETDLARRFGRSRVFRDIGMPAGVHWREHIAQQLRSCAAVVVVIGPRWLSVRSQGRRRIDQPEDVLRQELEYAIDSGIPMIPVLVDGLAAPPRPEQLPESLRRLTDRQALVIHENTWDHQMGVLIRRIAGLLSGTPEPWWKVLGIRHPLGWLLAALTVAVNLLLHAGLWYAAAAGALVLLTWKLGNLLADRGSFRSY